MIKTLFAAAALAAFAAALRAAAAQIGKVALTTDDNRCLVPTSDTYKAAIVVRTCTSDAVMYEVRNGYVRTPAGNCMDWSNEGGPIHLFPCKAGEPNRSSQQWYFHANKLAQNALRSTVCMDIKGGVGGGEILAWSCHNYSSPANNQKFYIGGQYSLLGLQSDGKISVLSAQRLNDLQRPGAWLLFNNGSRVIATGGGNVIAVGGGNVIATGGGNIMPANSQMRIVPDASQLFRGA